MGTTNASVCLPDVGRVSSFFRGYREVLQKPQGDTETKREGDKARPILGPQKLPTKALSAPLVPAFNLKVKKLESARQGRHQ